MADCDNWVLLDYGLILGVLYGLAECLLCFHLSWFFPVLVVG
jgi:hypothetical protein